MWRIGVDAAGRYLVTGSDDKTVRVWELATGRLLRVLRPPLGAGEASFRNNWLTGQQWRSEPIDLLLGPKMVAITPI